MKKLLCILLAVIAIAGSFSACAGNGGQINEEYSQSAVAREQAKLLASFGITLEKDRIVGYRETTDFLEYVVAIYEGDKKISEKNYIIFYREDTYKEDKDSYKNAAGVEFNDAAATVIYNSAKANTGAYATDLELIKKNYVLRTHLS